MGDRDFIVEKIASLFTYMKQIRYTKEETMTAISCSKSKEQKLDKIKMLCDGVRIFFNL